MKVNCVEQRLGHFATEYVEGRLRDGNALAQAILQRLSLKEGRITTCLPRGVIPKSLQDLQTGGKLRTPPPSQWRTTSTKDEILRMIPIPTTDDWLVEKIKEFLAGRKNRICIFEDSIRRVGDAALDKLNTTYATLNAEIYHLVFSAEAREERIQAVLRNAKAIPTFVGILTEWDGDCPSKSPLRLVPTQLESLTSRVHELIVGAFDGESYLIWDKGVSSEGST